MESHCAIKALIIALLSTLFKTPYRQSNEMFRVTDLEIPQDSVLMLCEQSYGVMRGVYEK